MAMDMLGKYRSLVVDHSVIMEFGGSMLFTDLLDSVNTFDQDVYVSKAFKILHYCVLHQADDRNSYVALAMKEFCGVLLPKKKLHSVQTVETCDFINSVKDLPDVAILATPNSVFVKRLLEKKPGFACDIILCSQQGYNVYEGLSGLVMNYKPKPISHLASLNKYLENMVYCNVGDYVNTGSDKRLELTKRISNGAEGMVFNTDAPGVVAKIYHKNVITPLRWSKLTKMVSMGIKSVGICWPQDLLFYRGVPVGYTMILGKGKTLGNIFDGPDAMVSNFPKWKRDDVVDTLLDLLEKYIYLHLNNIIAGDIQLKNALIYSSSSIYLIDMDSCQVDNMPCPVGTEDFTDPRLWDRDFSSFLRRLEDEDYSIAMLVFSVLFCGLHPYATRKGAETLREEIIKMNFPYTLDNSSDEHIPRGGYNYIWEYLPDQIRTMLYRVFKEGYRYETIEWYDAVLAYKEQLSAREFEDEEAYKVFPKMEYHMSADAVTVANDFNKPKSYTKTPFSTYIGNNNNGGFGVDKGLLTADKPNTQGASGRPSGPFVPRQQGTPAPVADDKKKDNPGLFGKFKRGLFN
ncbi:MAG: hypothetical protein K6F49_12030 [Saccharofermentans sp.]|nr:hypothetical protein [Saccharofermentans sp.]